jgi:hypothetical protein
MICMFKFWNCDDTYTNRFENLNEQFLSLEVVMTQLDKFEYLNDY